MHGDRTSLPTLAGEMLEVERYADEVTARITAASWDVDASTDAVSTLLGCLTSEAVRTDSDAEDAVCTALVHLGVMVQLGNRIFTLVPDDDLAPPFARAVQQHRSWLPTRYRWR
jgi:hypothetical protein